jgi:ABC-type glycerol-3-phosphate transport system substrate-binding protein
MRRLTGPIALVLAAGVLAAGCGGADKKSTATAAPTPTVTTLTTQEPAPAPAPSRSQVLDDAVSRLRKGGYKVTQLDVNPPAIAARKVGDHVLLYAYKTPTDAKAGAGVIKAAISEHPKRGLLDTEGSLVYFFGDARDVTAAERASFADLVDVGEGRTSP